MLIQIVGRLIPVIKSFIEKLRDRKLTGEELEELSVEAGLAIAAILKDIGGSKKD